MVSFFILLSFLLHLIIFITLYHGYERFKRDKDEQLEQINELLTNFMDDIRTENDKLEMKINEMDMHGDLRTMTDRFSTSALASDQPSPPLEKVSEWKAQERVKQTAPEDIVETSLESRVFQLVQEGK